MTECFRYLNYLPIYTCTDLHDHQHPHVPHVLAGAGVLAGGAQHPPQQLQVQAGVVRLGPGSAGGDEVPRSPRCHLFTISAISVCSNSASVARW